MQGWKLFAVALGATAASLVGGQAVAQGKNSLVIAMTLEPPGLDPTIAPAAAIGEVVHYNIFEGLTKIAENAEVQPLLADSWTVSPDMKVFIFKLKSGVKFNDGTAFDSADVKFSFEKYAGEKSTNKRKAVFTNIASIATPDAQTVTITLKKTDPTFLFSLGENTAVITAPESSDGNATKPVGTGPYKLENWVKGDSVTLTATDTYRNASAVKMKTVKIRFIADQGAMVAAMRAGDIDAIPVGITGENFRGFEKDKRYKTTVGSTEGETMLIINNKRKPFDDVRVRRALTMAIDRAGVLEAASAGYGKLIGSHFPPHDPAYVDLTKQYPYDPAKAKALLKEAGVNNLEVTLRLPPPAYARQAGEVIQAMLSQVGINAKIENVEWAQWLDGTFKNKNFDLTVISHVEPNDFVKYADPDYYFQYDSKKAQELIAKINSTLDKAERTKALQDLQHLLADDAVNVYLYNLPRLGVYKPGLTGFWVNAPIFVNDLTAVSWQ
ncbi:ABC transporter substrate-binding protein [Ferrovibrio sp.]|uniref:ABC transporter substrate-binding protein n=1 Tax=Ferrovibrio sp. TaxID=1917215 RepID=UPI000CBBF8DB|nr:ABC transporter substrate-binding protein [Ferrovibrio sp.]PJI43531.1 MAG: ABC transporter substrate-binding protein [Ferrovibrio sp.]